MKRLLLFLFSAVMLAQNPQTACFPGTVCDDTKLFVASARATTTTTGAVSATDTVIPVASTVAFTVPTIITIEAERIAVCTKTATSFTICTGGRGADQSTAATHSGGLSANGNITPIYHNQSSAEIQAYGKAISPHVKNYGAKGDWNGSTGTDDTTAIQNAINAVQGTNKILRCDGGRYKVTASPTVTVAPFGLDCGGTGSIEPVASSGTVYGLNLSFGGTSNATTVTVGVNTTSRATQTTKSITVASPTGFAVGDYMFLSGTQNSNAFIQPNRIQAIAGSVLTMWDPVGIPIQTTDTASVQKLGMGAGIYINGVSFDGAGLTGTAIGVGLRAAGVIGTFSNIQTKNFVSSNNTNGSAWVYCYGCTISNVLSTNDGSPAAQAASYLYASAKTTLTNISILSPAGFGFLAQYGVFNTLNNIISNGGNGRGIKTAGVGWSTGNGWIGNQDGNGYTGVSITEGTWRLSVSNVVANGNASSGLWHSGQDNIYNSYSGVQAIGNTSQDVSFAATDNFNTITGLSRQSVLADSGVGNSIRLEGQAGLSITANCTGTATSSATLFFVQNVAQAGTCAVSSPSVTQTSVVAPINGVLRGLRVKAGTGGVNGSSGIVTVRVNGTDTAVACTLGTGATCASPVSANVNVTAGDMIDIKFTTQASETLADLNVSVIY